MVKQEQKQQYIKDGYCIIGVTGEKRVRIVTDLYGTGLNFPILITTWKGKDKIKYYSVYFLDEKFKLEPLNNLRYEDEKEPSDIELFNEYIQYYVWYNFGMGFDVEVKLNGDRNE